ncbi:MAG: hypothetical protein HY583_04115 [Candidatus Omnitrophica bacterium]|nr:hypothetical protein [Candidatus Omnitrophota bacterium]
MNETSFDKPNAAKSIDIWIKIWGLGMALAGLSMFLIKSPLESIIISTGFGLALAFGKRIYAMRKMSLFFVGFLIFGAIALTYINTVVEPNRFRQIYFSISALFYIGLFTFLLTPDVKEAFGSSPIPRRLPPVLTQEEAKWIKFWTRLIAILMILESVVSYAFADWFRSHGLPPEGIVGASLGVVAALGLLFLRPNIGRRFALFV